jgi:energy-coupling factor transporter ATP-binding protein EcfA2
MNRKSRQEVPPSYISLETWQERKFPTRLLLISKGGTKMWVEEFSLENIRCFENVKLVFKERSEPFKWITLLSENGGGKSTILQAMALLLAGPEGSRTLLPRPDGWVRNEERIGKMWIKIHQGQNDPGKYGDVQVATHFAYSYFITGNERVVVNQKEYTEPVLQENPQRTLTWLRKNAFSKDSKGWFAVGYGCFRRLTRTSQVIVPSLAPQVRFTNFATQFQEDKPLSAFEQWMVHLEYQIRGKNKIATRQREIGIQAIDRLLPKGVSFSSVDDNGKILFAIGDRKVPTIALSDGYRSILALTGDLVWRLIQSFPDSDNPLGEEGVVLIDELDIHLHPIWQRDIAYWLQEQFPQLQFFVASHSPLVAAGAGEKALTYKFQLDEGRSSAVKITGLDKMEVGKILQSEAFQLVSPFSPQVQSRIDRYDELHRKGDSRTPIEENELTGLFEFMKELELSGKPSELDRKMDAYISRELSK